MLLTYHSEGVVESAKGALLQVSREKDRGSPVPRDRGSWKEDGKCSGQDKQKNIILYSKQTYTKYWKEMRY